MPDAILIIVSCREDEAQSIATPLVKEGLAACISIVPIVKSLYVWKGEFCQEQESLLLIKTSSKSWPNLEKRIKSLHSYSVPEIIAMPIESGNPEYLDWIDQITGKKLVDKKR